MQSRFRLVLCIGVLLALVDATKAVADSSPDLPQTPVEAATPASTPASPSGSNAKMPIVVRLTPAKPQSAVLVLPSEVKPEHVAVPRSLWSMSSGKPAVKQQNPAAVRIAQSTPAPPASGAPAPSQAAPSQPPANTVTTDDTPVDITIPGLDTTRSRITGPAKPGAAPESLNPDPNPLQFPTDPNEVRLRGAQPITLQQAIELAERNNRNLQTVQLQVQRSQFSVREAQAENFPTLNLQSTFSNSRSAGSDLQLQRQRTGQTTTGQTITGQTGTGTTGQTGTGTTGQTGTGTTGQTGQFTTGGTSFFSGSGDNSSTTSFSGSLNLSYDVFTSGARPARIRAAEQQLRSDQLELETTREQLRLDVTNDYYSLQEADETVRINEAAVRSSQRSLADAQALEQAGLGTRFDVLRSEVQLANARQDLINSISQQLTARRQLAQRLSIPEALDLIAADPIQIAGEWTLPLENSIVLAYRNRSELEQQLAQRELSNQQRRVALAGLGPTISVSASYNVVNQLNDDVGFGDGYTLQAGLNWSLFDGGAARARAAQQEANVAIAETRFADLRNQVRFQVEQAYFSLRSSRENVATAQRAVEQAEEALRLARLRFSAGVGTQTDVINAETDLTRARGNRLSAIIGYNRALASLRRAVTNIAPATNALTAPGTPAAPTPTAPTPSP